MARQLRIEYEGAIYHLLNRGDQREEIFRDELDRKNFLQTLERTCTKTGWQVHAYCLMNNHFHLVVETPRANLIDGMKWLLGTYTMSYNRRHCLNGHLFAGRYRSLLIDGNSAGYLRTACDYVHLNPVRARLLKKAEQLERYVWSSYPSYLGTPRRRPQWLRCDRLLGEHGLTSESRRNRLEFARRMEAKCGEVSRPEDLELIRRGWHFGAEDFLARVIDRLSKAATEHHYAKERVETDQEKAERIVRVGLKRLRWGEEQLRLRRKSDPKKIALAKELRNRTSVSLKWIAERLQMGSWSHVSNLLRKANCAKS
jgi:putative transposase